MIKNLKKYSMLIIVVLAIIGCFQFCVKFIEIEGSSMEPTLHDNEYLLVSTLMLDYNEIERFDIIVTYSEKIHKMIIKRVIGLPGETIEYIDDKLYVNGEYMEEPFLEPAFIEQTKKKYDFPCFTSDFVVTVGNDEYFVLGDNRIVSYDSRKLGCVLKEDIYSSEGLYLKKSKFGWLN